MIRADTHIHSIFSDGTMTPEEIVSNAKQEGLSLIALTDHNILSGNPRFAEAARNNGVNAVAGVEITTEYPGREIHLLSYFPLGTDFTDGRYGKLNETLDRIRARKVESNRRTLENLSKDFPVSFGEFTEYASASGKECSNFNRMNIAAYLVHKGILEETGEAFKTLLSDSSEYYVHTEKESLLETVRTVVECGGFPTIAHLSEYEKDLSLQDMERMLGDVAGITREFGVELFHYKHDERRRRTYMDLCSRIDADIVYTAGSDCHGDNKPNRIGYPYKEQPSEDHMHLYEEVSRKAAEFFGKRFAE